MIRRTATTAVMLATLALAATGCAGDDQPEAIPSTSSTPTATTPPPSPAPTTPAWQDKYTPDELAAYKAALQRFESYESRSEGIWAAGKATPAAQQLFQEYNGNSALHNPGCSRGLKPPDSSRLLAM